MEYGEPMLYVDVDDDISAVRERLLDSLLKLPETCFFRFTPKIVSEKQFDTNKIMHRAFYRYSPIKGFDEGIVGFRS